MEDCTDDRIWYRNDVFRKPSSFFIIFKYLKELAQQIDLSQITKCHLEGKTSFSKYQHALSTKLHDSFKGACLGSLTPLN